MLWERYFDKLVRMAAARLQGAPGSSAVESEESAALSAFESVCKGAKLGRFPRLSDREDLWQILVMVTAQGLRPDRATHGWQARRGPGSLTGHPGEG